jgi:4,5-DOPA dioxygenase extradiol
MPALFVGHGSPMNAIEENEFHVSWRNLGRQLPRPEAVFCISAHWETDGVALTGSPHPSTIHDFYGFPKSLFDVRYHAPGHPALARQVRALLKGEQAVLDEDRGLDHGCWSVLNAMYPAADVPVLQLSLPFGRPPIAHYSLAQRLAPLRSQGVLILGSGNVVHNLNRIDVRRAGGFDWAVHFDSEVKARILAGEHRALAEYDTLTPEARHAVPTPEHYLPLLYVLAVQTAADSVSFFNDVCVMGSISMTSVLLSPNG